jgi:hypothetical protein
MHPRVSVSRPVGRSRGRNSKGFGLGGWDTAKTEHEALLVVPGEVVGGDEFDVGEGAQRARGELVNRRGCISSCRARSSSPPKSLS